MDISALHVGLGLIALLFALAIPVISLYLGFSAVSALRDIRDALRERNGAG